MKNRFMFLIILYALKCNLKIYVFDASRFSICRLITYMNIPINIYISQVAKISQTVLKFKQFMN